MIFALDEGVVENNKLILNIPRSAVLYLRHTKNTPDVLIVHIITPKGSISYDIPVMKAKNYTITEIIDNGYNIDLCGYPHKEEIILEPKELIEQYQEKRASLNAEIDKILEEVSKLLEEE